MIYHGCGNATPIYEDFISMGLDAYNPLEAKSGLDVVELRRKYGHRMGFCGNMDALAWANAPLPELRRQVMHKLNAAKGGGYIFQSDHSVPSNVCAERYESVVNLVRKHGVYPLALGEFDEPDVGSRRAMTSRERVLTAFAHRTPDRVPAWCGASPAFWDAAKAELALDDEGLRVRLGDDFRRVGRKLRGAGSRTFSGGHVEEPLRDRADRHRVRTAPLPSARDASSVKDILDYPWPDPDWMDVATSERRRNSGAGQFAMLGGDWSPFWHDAIDFAGLDNCTTSCTTIPTPLALFGRSPTSTPK